MGRTTVTAQVVTEIPQTSPPAPGAWVESGCMSALLQACWDVRGVRSPSSVCATLRYGGILPRSCHLLKPLSSGSLPPLATESPSAPLPPAGTLRRGQGSCRGGTFPPALPRLAQRSSTYVVLQTAARLSLPCRRNYCLAQGRQQLGGSRGLVERTEP